MNIEQKHQYLNNYISNNYEDTLTIIKGITIKNSKHLDIEPEDILSIIYLNLQNRLERIEERYFQTSNKFRSILVNTINKQINWGVSAINYHKKKINSSFEEITTEIENIEEIEYDDKKDKDYDYLTNYYDKIEGLDRTTYDIVVKEGNYTTTNFRKATNLSISLTVKHLYSFKDRIRFTKKYENTLKDKNSIVLLSALHPNIRETIIQTVNKIENDNRDLTIRITEAYISRNQQLQLKKQKLTDVPPGFALSNFGLSFKFEVLKNNKIIKTSNQILHNFKVKGFIEDSPNQLSFTNGKTLQQIRSLHTANNWLKETKFVKL